MRKEFAQEYNQLYRSIVSTQKNDGRIMTYFGETSDSVRSADQYSGEALLVLAMEAEQGNRGALTMCRRAFAPYLQHFRNAPSSAFVGWHVDVWSRIALITGERDYSDFVFEQTEWLLQWQVQEHSDPRWIGGFSQLTSSPQFTSAVYLEAVARSLMLAVRTGDGSRATRYGESIRAGLDFCKQLRLEETPVALLGNPLRCEGGIGIGLVDRRIRCDAVQHFITMCVAVDQAGGCASLKSHPAKIVAAANP
jgi:hypothetical protein